MLAHDLRVQQRAVRLAGQRNRAEELRDLLEPHLGDSHLALPRHCRRALSGEEPGPVPWADQAAQRPGIQGVQRGQEPADLVSDAVLGAGGICGHVLARSSPGSCDMRMKRQPLP
jgi:hypothetical protein